MESVVKFKFSPLETLIAHHECSNVSTTEEEKTLFVSNKDVTQTKIERKEKKRRKQKGKEKGKRKK